MTGLIEHIERFCGPIVEGWAADPEGKELPFQIVRLSRGPIEGTVTFSTLGLSRYELPSRRSGKLIRHELLMLARHSQVPANLAPILQQIAAEALKEKYAYLRGEVIGPRNELFPPFNKTAFYVSNPVYFEEEFYQGLADEIKDITFAWLIAITGPEANFIRNAGWDKFENVLAEMDPDLLDLSRDSVVQ